MEVSIPLRRREKKKETNLRFLLRAHLCIVTIHYKSSILLFRPFESDELVVEHNKSIQLGLNLSFTKERTVRPSYREAANTELRITK